MPEVGTAVKEMACQNLIKLGLGNVTVRSGIAETVDTKEECFLIDSDFFIDERIKINDIDGILGYFNRQSGRLFKWAIEDRLHDAMEPRIVEAAV